MGRPISTYIDDSNVTGEDRLLGTDSEGNVTRNFPISSLTNVISSSITVGRVTNLNPNGPANIRFWFGTQMEFDTQFPGGVGLQADVEYTIYTPNP